MQILAVLVLIGFWVCTLILVNRALHNTGWSLADALSEDGQASSSRLIAFIFAVIAAGFLMGVSLYSLNRLFWKEQMPELNGVFQLLGTMTTMFIPYGINQFAGMLQTRAAQTPFAALAASATPQLPASNQLQIITVQGALVAGQSAVVTVLGTGFIPGMVVLLLNPSTGLAMGHVNGVAVQSAVQAQITATPGPATRGQTAVIQISTGVSKVTSPPLAVN
jgi:hypothetical protein